MMSSKLEKLLENLLFSYIAKGASIAVGIATAMLATVIFVDALISNAWWFLALIPCSILSGASFGIGCYLFDEC